MTVGFGRQVLEPWKRVKGYAIKSKIKLNGKRVEDSIMFSKEKIITET